MEDPKFWGGKLSRLGPGGIKELLAWLRNDDGSSRPECIGEGEFPWALVTALDGVTWLAWDSGHNRWQSAASTFPSLCGNTNQDSSLLTVRVFGPAAEALLWPAANGLTGRLLSDNSSELEPHQKPVEEKTRLLIGREVVSCKDGFAHLSSRSGARQVLPLGFAGEGCPGPGSRVKATIALKHYLGDDGDSGAVRVVASRLSAFSWEALK